MANVPNSITAPQKMWDEVEKLGKTENRSRSSMCVVLMQEAMEARKKAKKNK